MNIIKPTNLSHQYVCICLLRYLTDHKVLTGDVQSEVDSRTSSRQTESHDDKDGGVWRDAHQHPEHHRQGQGGQQSPGPAQPAETQI